MSQDGVHFTYVPKYYPVTCQFPRRHMILTFLELRNIVDKWKDK